MFHIMAIVILWHVQNFEVMKRTYVELFDNVIAIG